MLEGLEPVRRRPGMYIGGTDEKALHHLFAEVIDNSMDEAVAGHADWIDVELEADGFVTVSDNGRGIPVDPHPKFKNKSALEVIMSTLHAGGKFDSKVYETSGGLHGVGVSVVNALSERMEVEVARDQTLYTQTFERGKPKGKLEKPAARPTGAAPRSASSPTRRFSDESRFQAERVFKMTRSKAYLFGGVEIRWRCDKRCSRASRTCRKRRRSISSRSQGLSDRDARRRTLVHPDIFTGTDGKDGGRRGAMGRRLGRRSTASSTPTATPFRRPKAARMRRACAMRCCAG